MAEYTDINQTEDLSDLRLVGADFYIAQEDWQIYQAVANWVMTPKGSLPDNPEYGSDIRYIVMQSSPVTPAEEIQALVDAELDNFFDLDPTLRTKIRLSSQVDKENGILYIIVDFLESGRVIVMNTGIDPESGELLYRNYSFARR